MPPTHNLDDQSTQAPLSCTPQRGRPRLDLSDDEGRSLALQVQDIDARHAGSPRQHRPYVHDFLRAVYHATGRLYSAGFYRRLLGAYAPGRTPSTATIELERKLLQDQLKQQPLPATVRPPDPVPLAVAPAALAPRPVPGAATDLAQLQVLGMLQQLTGRFEQFERSAGGDERSAGYQAHNDYLQERIRMLEADLANAQAMAARLRAASDEQASLAEERGRQLAALQAALNAQTEAMAKLSASIDGDRAFFAMQVDGVRGETRAVRERCAQLEQLLKEKDKQVDMYRNMVLSKGATR